LSDNNVRESILKAPLLYVGAIVQILGYVVYFKGIFEDPRYGFLAILTGYIFVSVICLEKLLRRAEATTSPIIMQGEPVMKTKQHLYSRKTRLFSLIALIAATTGFGIFSYLLFAHAESVEAPPIELTIQEYRKRQFVFRLVDVFRPEWKGNGAIATVEGDGPGPYSGKSLAYAVIINPNKDKLDLLTGTACVLMFDLQTRQDRDSVRIDDITVTVQSYDPLPKKYSLSIPAPSEQVNLYYVEMDAPRGSKTSVFKPRFFYEKGQKKETDTVLGAVRLEKGKPETFAVRINARTPGIYEFIVELLLSYKNEKEKVTLTPPTQFLFDGNYNRKK
jgi:hypothetical protein